MIRVPIQTPSSHYEAIIQHGSLARVGAMLRLHLGDVAPLFVVTTAPVRRRWGKRLQKSLVDAGFSPKLIEMPDGERYKRLATIELLAGKLIHSGADRKAVIVAFGGGVVGDVAGMLASVYMRGVKLVQIPTTVQAQLDAAIGGKTGVNLKAGKNLIGTFYQPEVVLIDPEVLSTLPPREFRAGMYEALKASVIGNVALFNRLEKSAMKSVRKDAELVTWVIAEAVKLKARVVSADEKEGDLRRVLNFGHTIGHALEAATDYREFLHGEAVAWGMQAAAHIAVQTKFCDTSVYERISSAIHGWGPLPAVSVQTAKALRLLQSDKKTEAGHLHFVLPKEIGRVDIVKNIPQQVIASALAEIRRASRG